ncbi:hypothetical protein YB2330_005410 [Saitoella coloradoensis]
MAACGDDLKKEMKACTVGNADDLRIHLKKTTLVLRSGTAEILCGLKVQPPSWMPGLQARCSPVASAEDLPHGCDRLRGESSDGVCGLPRYGVNVETKPMECNVAIVDRVWRLEEHCGHDVTSTATAQVRGPLPTPLEHDTAPVAKDHTASHLSPRIIYTIETMDPSTGPGLTWRTRYDSGSVRYDPARGVLHDTEYNQSLGVTTQTRIFRVSHNAHDDMAIYDMNTKSFHPDVLRQGEVFGRAPSGKELMSVVFAEPSLIGMAEEWAKKHSQVLTWGLMALPYVGAALVMLKEKAAAAAAARSQPPESEPEPRIEEEVGSSGTSTPSTPLSDHSLD